MPTFAIESNGRLEKTAVYYNGEQIGGVKEIFLSLNEDGDFDAIIQYEGVDRNIHTKNIFTDSLDKIKVVEPSFTEEEAKELQLLEIESDGDIQNTMVYYNNEPLEGLVSLYLHIKATQNKNGIRSLFSSKRNIPDTLEFKSEFIFRNEDDTLESEVIF